MNVWCLEEEEIKYLLETAESCAYPACSGLGKTAFWLEGIASGSAAQQCKEAPVEVAPGAR